ncbi:MAG: Unknown protein [uncultured Sulfurovum sp.]|uniref:Lipoprotein n=1 Tax=uncultured Sulfurovum sp. TaxID=269237 RepID=A0A6S6TKP0_9BACT|nr:MAG: Unknown protein [uncultured Sulfurovum sp.]
MELIIIGINMVNKKVMLIIMLSLLIFGCSSATDMKVKYPFETLEIITSPKNSTMSIVVIKTGIKGGATVPFGYNFYFSKDDKNLNENNIFLSVRGLETYKINWTSENTIDINIDASRILMFQSEVVLLEENPVSDFYYVNNISFKKR